MQGIAIAVIIFCLACIVAVILHTFSKLKNKGIIITQEFKEIADIIENTSESVFITGKAGTGKSTLLKYIKKRTKKKFVVLAPTGVAALNVGGQTINSFFRFPPKLLNEKDIIIQWRKTAQLFARLEMVVIDEVSMVSADLMNAIDLALRKNRDKMSEPFGGVQIIFFGDLYQLPPVVKEQDKPYFEKRYGGIYFFDAPVFKEGFKYRFKELTYVFRQEDEEFKKLLNQIREDNADFETLAALNSRHIENLEFSEDGTLFITTTKKIARQKNKENLEKIGELEYSYKAILSGTLKQKLDRIDKEYQAGQINEDQYDERLDHQFPASVILKVKKHAQIMMIKNDPAKRWVNGSIGQIVELEENTIWVVIEGNKHKVEREIWKEIEYTYSSTNNKIEEIEKGRFAQFPMILAWAITVHKSQGKTFDKIAFDIGNGAFAHGQTYVALSRCRSLDGITLLREVQPKDIIVDPRVIEYHDKRS